MTSFHRRSVFAFVLGATLAAAVLVGRSAFATTETINACFKPSNGTLYLLGESSGRQACQPGDIPISWNTSGVNGQDGVSVTSEQLSSGSSPCQNGGSKFTAVSGVTYACNGSNGVDGEDGQNGQDGADGADGASVTLLALAPGDDTACPNGGTKFTVANSVSYACNGSNGEDGQDGQDGQFSGTFESPNHLFKLVVDDTTAKMEGSGGSVQITPSGVLLAGPAGNMALTNTGTSLTSAGAITLNAAASLVAQANSAALTSAGQLALQVGSATLNSAGSLAVQANSASLNSAGQLTVQANSLSTQANSTSLNSANAFTIASNGAFSASARATTIGGSQDLFLGSPVIRLNGNGCGLLRRSDVFHDIAVSGGLILSNPDGSPTVRTTC